MNMNRLILKLLAPFAAVVLWGSALAAEPLPVTASFSILGDLVRVVGGDRVAVTTLVGPEEDAHVFEPRPADARNIVRSRLLVLNGLGFEPWAQKLARSAAFKGTTLVASNGVKARTLPAEKGHDHNHADTDPHAWQDPTNVMIYVRNIAATLSQLDPAGAASFRVNSDAYVAELQALDAWARQQIAQLPKDKRRVITSHDAFGYFAAHYGLEFLAPQGVSTDAEPSAKAVAALIRQIQREKIRAVFFENMGNPKLLAQLSRDAGVTPGAELYADALSAPGKPGATYLSMMRHNIGQLTAGMQQN
ncbi:MAG: metal transporter substrate-binding protein [Rhodoferax sp.]|nr:metal transporter substrate-binding protein [Rhodoferax sp.]